MRIAKRLSIDPASQLFVSSDLDDARARISKVMQPHRLRPLSRASAVSARMSFLRMPGLGLGTIRFGAMGLELDYVDDYHLLIFCIEGAGRFMTRAGDIEIGGASGICLAPGEPVRAEFSEDCEQFVVRIDASAMRRACTAREPALHRRIDLTRAVLRPWANLAHLMTNDAATLDLLRRDKTIGGEYAELFVSALLQGQEISDGAANRMIAPASVKRAEAYIDACFAEDLTLSDIARAAAVPVRTLLHGFQHFRDDTPMRCLRNRRLDEAKALLIGGRGVRTVAQVATEVGFHHLGRFSQEYRARFGEAPSASLQRSRLS